MKQIIKKIIHILQQKELLLFGAFILFLIFCILSQQPPKKEILEDTEYYTHILLDVSKSMEIQDMPGNISRLAFTKKQILSNINPQKPLSLGLSIFAGEGIRILPFTRDTKIFTTFLASLDANNLREQGSRIDLGLLTAIQAFQTGQAGEIIIFTDQDSREKLEKLEEVKKALQEKNIALTFYAVGSEMGAPLIEGWDIFGTPVYKKYRGEIVRAPLEIKYLKELSSKLSADFKILKNDTQNIFGENRKNILSNESMLEYKNISLFISFVFWILFLGAFYNITFMEKNEKI